MKLLITGAGGMLGRECAEMWVREGHDVVALTHADLDIADESAVQSAVENCAPDVILHAAAYTAVDDAESHPEECDRVNVLGTRHVARAARDHDVVLCYISTDYVFEGSGVAPYVEDDRTDPINHYGYSKWLGEEAIREVHPRHYIVRVSWLCGVYGRNFVDVILQKASELKQLTVVNDQVGSPTFTYDLAKTLLSLLSTNEFGTYHMVSEGYCSWYEFAQEILQQSGLTTPLVAMSSADLNAAAKRPANSRLNTDKLKHILKQSAMPRWQDALAMYMKQRKAIEL